MLKITLNDWKKWAGKGETLAVFEFEEQVPETAKADGFKAKESETFVYHPEKSLPADRVVLIGLGKKKEFSLEALRRAAANAAGLAITIMDRCLNRNRLAQPRKGRGSHRLRQLALNGEVEILNVRNHTVVVIRSEIGRTIGERDGL